MSPAGNVRASGAAASLRQASNTHGRRFRLFRPEFALPRNWQPNRQSLIASMEFRNPRDPLPQYFASLYHSSVVFHLDFFQLIRTDAPSVESDVTGEPRADLEIKGRGHDERP